MCLWRSLSYSALISLFAIVISCEGERGPVGALGPTGPTGPAGPPGPAIPYITGAVEDFNLREGRYVWVDISSIGTIATVQLNEITIPLISRNMFRYENYPFQAGDSANLVVTYSTEGSLASARSTIILPSRFEILSHDTSLADTIIFGANYAVRWSSSSNATAYRGLLSLSYFYLDTSGIEESYFSSFDTLVVDTSLFFSDQKLFPNYSQIDSIIEGRVFFQVKAISGPCAEGNSGNITGDAMGFFNGYTFGGELRLVIINGARTLNRAFMLPEQMN